MGDALHEWRVATESPGNGPRNSIFNKHPDAEGGSGNSHLDYGQVTIHVPLNFSDHQGAPIPRLDQFINPGRAKSNEGELPHHKEEIHPTEEKANAEVKKIIHGGGEVPERMDA
jgi:hypothetical protein